jgi:hypothetical protein
MLCISPEDNFIKREPYLVNYCRSIRGIAGE